MFADLRWLATILTHAELEALFHEYMGDYDYIETLLEAEFTAEEGEALAESREKALCLIDHVSLLQQVKIDLELDSMEVEIVVTDDNGEPLSDATDFDDESSE